MNQRIVHQSIIIASAAAVYGSTLGHPFHFDGIYALQNNPILHNWFDPAAIWAKYPSRFIPYLTFSINHHLGGGSTAGYHIVNIAIHVACSLLVYHLAGLITATAALREGPEPPAAAPIFQLAAGLLFAVHPLQTQAVTYIFQRAALLAAMFYLMSLVFYLKSALVEEGRPAKGEDYKGWLALSLAAALAAMISKPNAFTLPAAIIMMDLILISGGFKRLAKRAWRLTPFIPLIFVVPVTSLYLEPLEQGLKQYLLSPVQYLYTQFNVHLLYLKLIFWPAGQNLDYDFPPADSITDAALSLAILLSMAALAFKLLKTNRPAAFGILFYFLAHSVESSFFPLEDLVFEHRNYLPSAGLFIAATSLGAMAARYKGGQWEKAVAGLLILASLSYAVAAWERNKVWSSRETLWLDVVQKSPDKWRAYSALGVHYNSLGDRKKAITMFEESKKKDPARPDPYINLCALYPSEGNLEDAGVNCRKGLKLKPGSFEANFNYGAYNFKMKRYEKSARFYGRAAKIRPYSIPSKLGQGAALAAMGNTAEAMRIFREILGQNPWNKQAHYNMAIIYKSLGNEAMANEHIQKARQGAPGK